MLSGAVAGQRFESVARRSAKVLDAGRVVDPVQLASRPAQDRREAGRIDPGRCPDAFEDESASALGDSHFASGRVLADDHGVASFPNEESH